MKKLCVFALSVAVLSGCAAQYHVVDSSKVLSAPPAVDDVGNSAFVTIQRDASLFGSALDGRFIYDGVHVVTLSFGEVYSFSAKPGKHRLGVKSYQPIMFIPVPFEREIEVDFEEKRSYEYILKTVPSEGLGIVVRSNTDEIR